jgi:F-type H+-transporting ATPase subunit gamma
MPSTKEIKNRIKSVSDTQKITNAMYLISSTKMRRARKEAEETKPYFDLLRKEIRRMFAVGTDLSSRYYDADVDENVAGGRNAILVITGDKGLAGAYNQNVLKETQALIDKKVVELVRGQHQKALRILQENKQKMDELAEHLYFRETITGEEFMAILNRKPVPKEIPMSEDSEA